MRKKLLTAVLTLSLAACIEEQPKDSESKEDVNMVQTYIETSEPKLDFEYVYNKTSGKQRFSRAISKEEEELFYDRLYDSLDSEDQSDIDRFNRKREEPRFNGKLLADKETKIRLLLDQCNALIGPEAQDSRFDLNSTSGEFYMFYPESTDLDYIKKSQPIYLTGRMLKCVNYLYLNNGKSSYDFSDFEYPDKGLKISEQKQKIERLYEQIYLEVKAAGLLRKIFYAYYPKSFLREHADQTGLTKFIQEKEAKADKPLKHDELAAEFFGSREKWIESFDQFLDQKVINSKIETQVDKAA